ncbi:energy transducer TonB [Kordiimonas lipolytica]|uniref:Protein TonB n=1 Tax=Kordiimonas lipolytica TaxID=1662421 RepID=A0ABV8U5D5_9PROT|nr:TonB family protein [Kordiimonas lipolytica]
MFVTNALKSAVVAATVLVAVSSQVTAADTMQSWKVALLRAVSQNQSYPRAALMREIEGKAKVRLIVAADGTITAHEILEATGQDLLDREIPKLVAKLNPLPALPEGQTDMKIVLPLEWALQ